MPKILETGQLPGQILVGEGKPNNQNHAIIFTRGEAVQAIDMNQDATLEDAIKIRQVPYLRYSYDCVFMF